MKPHRFLHDLDGLELAQRCGYVRKVAPGLIEATGPVAMLGDLCDVAGDPGSPPIPAEVIAVDDRGIVLIPLEDGEQVRLDAKVVARGRHRHVPVGDGFAGRAVDALGRAIDGGGAIVADTVMPLIGMVPRPMDRADPIRVLETGLRAVDGLLTLGVGQRVGIFAASGVGKTSLIEQIAAQTTCDRCILCLVGERGREVEGLWRTMSARKDAARFTMVAATSDQSAALRARSVQFALCLADHWRARGEHVLLIVDSVTRMAMALREIGLAAGAPPTVRAYTPNVFSALPRIVERCGAVRGGGATTAIMTILSETDDIDDPIVELMKSLLDGHIILSRTLAEQGHFPAIDVARSVSRQSAKLVSEGQVAMMREAVALLARYEDSRVMIESGVYASGSNLAIDRAIAARAPLAVFLKQGNRERTAFGETTVRMQATLAGVRADA